MRIMHVVPELKLAGAQIMVENLSSKLKGKGQEPIIVSLYNINTPIVERLNSAGIKVYFLDKKSGFDPRAILRLRKLIKKEKPDIIHTHSYALKYAYFAVKATKYKRLVHTVHNLADRETTPINLKLERKLFRKGKVQPVAISPLIKESIMLFYDLGSDSVPMIFNGIPLDKCLVKKDYKEKNDRVRIIHIGRFQEQKNHEMIVRAMVDVCKKHPESKLSLFGEGELLDSVKKQVEELKIDSKIVFEGLTDDPYKELNSSDIFILPSKWEGMPITLIEAMASAMPCVVTAVGGVPDMVEDNISGLISEIDESDLSEKICYLIENEDVRKRLGEAALEKSKMFSSDEMCDKYIDLYKRMM